MHRSHCLTRSGAVATSQGGSFRMLRSLSSGSSGAAVQLMHALPRASVHALAAASAAFSRRAGRAPSAFASGLDPAPPEPADGAAPLGEVAWSKEELNAVTLVGNTGRGWEVKYLDSGSIVGTTSLAQKDSKNNTQWFKLETWGRTAELARDQVPSGSAIRVQGRLRIDRWKNKEGQDVQQHVVVVNDLKFIARGNYARGGASDANAAESYAASQSAGPPQPPAFAQQDAARAQAEQERAQAEQEREEARYRTVDSLWRECWANPMEWYDQRVYKDPQHPDFDPQLPDFQRTKGTETGETSPEGVSMDRLQIDNKYTPQWVKDQLYGSS